MSEKRTAQIETSCSIKINTGNFETLDVSKKMVVDIEFGSPEEFINKSKKVDAILINLVQKEAEVALERMGRSRCAKAKGQEFKVGLWEDFESAFSDH